MLTHLQRTKYARTNDNISGLTTTSTGMGTEAVLEDSSTTMSAWSTPDFVRPEVLAADAKGIREVSQLHYHAAGSAATMFVKEESFLVPISRSEIA